MKKKISVKVAKGSFYMTDILDEYSDGSMQAIHNSEVGDITKVVYLVTQKDEKFIMKTVTCKINAEDEIELARSEYKIAKECSELTPNIVCPLKIGEYRNEETEDFSIESLYEYGGESLANKIGKINCSELLSIARQTIEAFSVLESRGIFHSDIKPENIVISGDNLKIIDFGVSRDFENRTKLYKATITLSKKIVGYTCHYCPPEVLGETKSYIMNKIDVYCWGMTLYQLITGKDYDTLSTELEAYKLPGKKVC